MNCWRKSELIRTINKNFIPFTHRVQNQFKILLLLLPLLLLPRNRHFIGLASNAKIECAKPIKQVEIERMRHSLCHFLTLSYPCFRCRYIVILCLFLYPLSMPQAHLTLLYARTCASQYTIRTNTA